MAGWGKVRFWPVQRFTNTKSQGQDGLMGRMGRWEDRVAKVLRTVCNLGDGGTHLVDRRTRLARVARSRRNCGIGRRARKKVLQVRYAGRRGGWSFSCGSFVLLYVRVNVKPGQGRKAGRQEGRQLVAGSSSPARHPALTVTTENCTIPLIPLYLLRQLSLFARLHLPAPNKPCPSWCTSTGTW